MIYSGGSDERVGLVCCVCGSEPGRDCGDRSERTVTPMNRTIARIVWVAFFALFVWAMVTR